MKAFIVDNQQQLKDALTVRHHVFVVEQNIPREVEEDGKDQTATHVIVYDRDKSIATGRFRVINDSAKMERIAVLSAYRGRGIGKMVIQELEREAVNQGLSSIKLHAQVHAQTFYEKLDYKPVSEVFEEQNIPHVVMQKNWIRHKY